MGIKEKTVNGAGRTKNALNRAGKRTAQEVTMIRAVTAAMVLGILSFSAAFYFFAGLPALLFVFGLVSSLLTIPLVALYIIGKM